MSVDNQRQLLLHMPPKTKRKTRAICTCSECKGQKTWSYTTVSKHKLLHGEHQPEPVIIQPHEGNEEVHCPPEHKRKAPPHQDDVEYREDYDEDLDIDDDALSEDIDKLMMAMLHPGESLDSASDEDKQLIFALKRVLSMLERKVRWGISESLLREVCNNRMSPCTRYPSRSLCCRRNGLGRDPQSGWTSA